MALVKGKVSQRYEELPNMSENEMSDAQTYRQNECYLSGLCNV